MKQNPKDPSKGAILVVCLLLFNAIVMEQGLVASPDWYFLLLLSVPLLVASIIAFKKKGH